jgi:hypothetical protein
MIESFGGRVTQNISGKTDVLLVGKELGLSKVTKARKHAKIKMTSLKYLKDGLDDGVASLEHFEFFQRKEPVKIEKFSLGYQYSSTLEYNGLALHASQEELAIAQGFVPATAKYDGSFASTVAKPEVIAIDDDRKPTAEPTLSTKKRKHASSNTNSKESTVKKAEKE